MSISNLAGTLAFASEKKHFRWGEYFGSPLLWNVIKLKHFFSFILFHDLTWSRGINVRGAWISLASAFEEKGRLWFIRNLLSVDVGVQFVAVCKVWFLAVIVAELKGGCSRHFLGFWSGGCDCHVGGRGVCVGPVGFEEHAGGCQFRRVGFAGTFAAILAFPNCFRGRAVVLGGRRVLPVRS